jgi:adenylosuccinate lyase
MPYLPPGCQIAHFTSPKGPDRFYCDAESGSSDGSHPVGHEITAKGIRETAPEPFSNRKRYRRELGNHFRGHSNHPEKGKLPQPYETLKELTRTNMHIDKDYLHAFIRSLDISQEVKDELLQITPSNYTGQ